MADESRNTSESNREFQQRMGVTIGELRGQYGEHFAPGYGDQDTLGELLGRAGYDSLDQYLNDQHHHSMTPKSSN
jgi:hypothetical protein